MFRLSHSLSLFHPLSVSRLSVLQRSAICIIYPQCKICKFIAATVVARASDFHLNLVTSRSKISWARESFYPTYAIWPRLWEGIMSWQLSLSRSLLLPPFSGRLCYSSSAPPCTQFASINISQIVFPSTMKPTFSLSRSMFSVFAHCER
jgi:hypothetical protein